MLLATPIVTVTGGPLGVGAGAPVEAAVSVGAAGEVDAGAHAPAISASVNAATAARAT